MSLETISPCSFEDTSSETYPSWGFLGYSKAARFEAKSDTEIELYSYPLIKKGLYKLDSTLWYDVPDGTYSLAGHVRYPTKIDAYFDIRLYTQAKTTYEVLQEAPFVDGLEVSKESVITNARVWTRFKKPFSPDGRGGDSIEILNNTIEAPFLSAFQFDEIPAEIPQDEYFYVKDIFPDEDVNIVNSLSPFCDKLHFSLATEKVKLRIKGETIETETPWENGASTVQTFPSKIVTYYFEKVPYVGIRGSFRKYGYTQVKYSWSFIEGAQEVLWVNF